VKKRGFCGRRRETGGIWWALREAARRHDRHIIFLIDEERRFAGDGLVDCVFPSDDTFKSLRRQGKAAEVFRRCRLGLGDEIPC